MKTERGKIAPLIALLSKALTVIIIILGIISAVAAAILISKFNVLLGIFAAIIVLVIYVLAAICVYLPLQGFAELIQSNWLIRDEIAELRNQLQSK